MLRFILSFVVFVPFYLLGMLLAPVLREGPAVTFLVAWLAVSVVFSPLLGACIHFGTTGRTP